MWWLIPSTHVLISLPILKWEADLAINQHKNIRAEMCLKMIKMTKSSKPSMSRGTIHCTGQKMFKMGLKNSGISEHCTGGFSCSYMLLCAIAHMPICCGTWQRICESLSNEFKCPIIASPSLCVLSMPGAINLDVKIHFTTSRAKISLTMIWKFKKQQHNCQPIKYYPVGPLIQFGFIFMREWGLILCECKCVGIYVKVLCFPVWMCMICLRGGVWGHTHNKQSYLDYRG